MNLTADQRRALSVLAEAGGRGIPERVLVQEHGFTVDTLARLVFTGCASVAAGKMEVDGRMTDVVRVIATDAGRRAVAH